MRGMVISLLALRAVAHADAVVPGEAKAFPVPVEGPFEHLPTRLCSKELPPVLPVWGEFTLVEPDCQDLPNGNVRHVLSIDTASVWYVVPLGESGKVLHEGLPMEVHFTFVGMRLLSTERLEVRYREDLFGVHEHLVQCYVAHNKRPICKSVEIRPAAPR
jgi:hypothetical protein